MLRIEDRPSPNHGPRPPGVRPDLIVIHGSAGDSAAGDLSWIRNPASKVSYHYLVGRNGNVYRLVPESRRAWHAGVSSWQGRPDTNDYSIGISLSNRGPGEPFTPEQYTALIALTRDVMARWNIPQSRIVGHLDVAPGRKFDPWDHFDWRRFRTGLP